MSEVRPWILSIACYGGPTGIGHRGITLNHSDSSICKIHHVRYPTETAFVYDPRTQPLTDSTLCGRHVIRKLSDAEKTLTDQTLESLGNDDSNLPLMGSANCQDWVAAAVGVLERLGLVGEGDARFWVHAVGMDNCMVAELCLQSGRSWNQNSEMLIGGQVDARFEEVGNRDGARIGRLEMGSRIESLEGIFARGSVGQ